MEPKPIYIKPALKPGTQEPVTVRWPDKPAVTIPAEGMFVPPTAYWLRRLRDGSVHEATPPRKTDGQGRAGRKQEGTKSTSKE